MSGMVAIEWQHPRLGRIAEVACPMHEREVLTALRMLGIGCGGTEAPEAAICLRCIHKGTRPRVFLRAAVSP